MTGAPQIYFATSGTTGNARRTAWTQEMVRDSTRRTQQALNLAYPEMDHLAVAHAFGPWLIGVDLMMAAVGAGADCTPLGRGDLEEYTAVVLHERRAVLATTPLYARRLMSWFEMAGRTPPKIDGLLLSGSLVNVGEWDALSRLWSAPVASLYGTAEHGSLAIQLSPNEPMRLLHASVEFASTPVTNVEPKIGELTVRWPNDRWHATGDLVKVSDSPVDDTMSSRSPLLSNVRLLGRIDQAVTLDAGAKLARDQMAAALRAAGYDGAWQLLIDEGTSETGYAYDSLELRIAEGHAPTLDPVSLVAELRRNVDLEPILSQGTIRVTTDSFATTANARKVPAIVDLRPQTRGAT